MVRSQISDYCLEVRETRTGGDSAGVPTLLGTVWCMCSAGWMSRWLTLVLSSGSGSLPGVCSSSVCCCSGAGVLLGISPEQVSEPPARPCSGPYREGGWQSEHSLLRLLLCQAQITNRSAEV